MLIVDAHQDIAYNHVSFLRDYKHSVEENRRREAHTNFPKPALGFPDAMKANVGIIFTTLFAAPKGAWQPQWNEPYYSTPREAYTHAMSQLDYYRRLEDEHDQICIIQNKKDLQSVLSSWEIPIPEDKPDPRKQGFVILMEGADPILEPQQFEEWYERGVRIVGPAWQATRYSGGTHMPGPLTLLGFELLEVMASFGAILDLSHLAEKAYYQAIERYEGTVIASHSNPRKFCNTDRHLSDKMIHLLAERDGVMGIVMYNKFLSEEWSPTDPSTAVSLSTVADAIDYVCQLTGSAKHVGIGSDFDGGFGTESIPYEMDTVSDIIQLTTLLYERGYSESDVQAIMGGNMIRKLHDTL